MDCLVLPVSMFRKCYTGNARLGGYRELTGDGFGELDGPVTVVVGKEKREFLVDPFVLEESPFRFLLETAKRDVIIGGSCNYDHHRHQRGRGRRRSSSPPPVIFVDVDAILFEHMLWLMYNDCSSLFKLNLEEIIDFYAQEDC